GPKRKLQRPGQNLKQALDSDPEVAVDNMPRGSTVYRLRTAPVLLSRTTICLPGLDRMESPSLSIKSTACPPPTLETHHASWDRPLTHSLCFLVSLTPFGGSVDRR